VNLPAGRFTSNARGIRACEKPSEKVGFSAWSRALCTDIGTDQVFGRKSQVSGFGEGYVFKVIAAINATRRDTFPEPPSCLVSLH
jgi:hypothetical protein